MHHTEKKYITSNAKMVDVILENPAILFLLEHFEIDLLVKEKTITQICADKNISVSLFLTFVNMFYGVSPSNKNEFKVNDICVLLSFLKKSHSYFRDEKYPQIINLIKDLYKTNNLPEIKMIGKFFDEYYNEVNEHLEYEENVVFPYFQKLISGSKKKSKSKFTVNVYKEHHSDIQYKLHELNQLLLKHIPIQNDRRIRREIIIRLHELEYYLDIHSKIEDMVLIPIIESIENRS